MLIDYLNSNFIYYIVLEDKKFRSSNHRIRFSYHFKRKYNNIIIYKSKYNILGINNKILFSI